MGSCQYLISYLFTCLLACCLILHYDISSMKVGSVLLSVSLALGRHLVPSKYFLVE